MNIPQWIRESNLIEGIDDVKEDERCTLAWRQLQNKEWTLGTILWLHRRIMWVLNRRIAGRFRECDVRVGSYVAIPWDTVPSQMEAWVWNSRFAHERGWDAPLGIRRAHIDFEHIHPFEDGNGRVGRMLMNWSRKKAGLEPMCIFSVGKYVYYEWFRQPQK